MRWAVHRLQAESRTLRFKEEHVLLILLVVTGRLPEIEIEDVGRNDLLIPTNSILLSDHFNQLVVDVGTRWVPESATWGQTEVIEQALLLTDDTMVAALSLLEEMKVLIELLLGGERDGINSLQTVIRDLAEPVSSRVFHDFETLDELRGWDMRARAHVNQITAAVCRDALAIFYLTIDHGLLERIMLEHFQSLLLRQNKAFKRLLFTCNFLGALIDRIIVFVREFLQFKS